MQTDTTDFRSGARRSTPGIQRENDFADTLAALGVEFDEPSEELHEILDVQYMVDRIIRRIPRHPYSGGIAFQFTTNPKVGKKRGEFLARARAVCDRRVYVMVEETRLLDYERTRTEIGELVLSAIRVWLSDASRRERTTLGIRILEDGSCDIYDIEKRIREDAQPVLATVNQRFTGVVERFDTKRGIGLIACDCIPGDGRTFLFFFHVNDSDGDVSARLESGETNFEVLFENSGFRDHTGERDLPSARGIMLPLADASDIADATPEAGSSNSAARNEPLAAASDAA